jgi:hypothetical protein
MQAQDIVVERRETGVFALVSKPIFGGETITEIIWSRTGDGALEFLEKTDTEIQGIAFKEWQRFSQSQLRRKKNK